MDLRWVHKQIKPEDWRRHGRGNCSQIVHRRAEHTWFCVHGNGADLGVVTLLRQSNEIAVVPRTPGLWIDSFKRGNEREILLMGGDVLSEVADARCHFAHPHAGELPDLCLFDGVERFPIHPHLCNRCTSGKPVWAVRPPSTTIAAPVMNDASSEARNRTVLAISSGSPIRPNGWAWP